MTERTSTQRLRAEQINELGQLSMRSHRDADVHALRLTGELDLANAGDVEQELLRIEGTDAGTILLDLTGLTFVDSTGLRLLITAHARTREDGDRLALLRPPAHIMRILRIAGIDERLPFAG